MVKNPPVNPQSGKVPWRRKQQPIPVFLPGRSHGQSNLADYSPCCQIVRHNLTNKTTTKTERYLVHRTNDREVKED